MSTKKPITDPALKSWDDLNEHIMQMDDEEDLQKLLDLEIAGRRRQQFVFRIHSRINKLRADRERDELKELLK